MRRNVAKPREFGKEQCEGRGEVLRLDAARRSTPLAIRLTVE